MELKAANNYMNSKNSNNSDSQTTTWPALDVVKFVCVTMMVFIHAHMALITDSYRIINTHGFFYQITNKLMFLGLFLTALPMIAGAVLRMNNNRNFGETIKTAIFISLLGFLMNMITWGAGYTFSWNILQLIGLSFIVIVFLEKEFSHRAVFWVSLIVVFLAVPLRNFLGTLDYNYFVSIFIGADNGFIFWPFFPWFGVVGFGFLFAHYYLKYKDSLKFRMSAMLAGIGLLAIAVFRHEISPSLGSKYVWNSSLFQPAIGWVLASMGLFLVLVAVGSFLFNKIKLKKYGIINSYSKGILWIYVAQMFVSYKLSFLVKNFFSMSEPSRAYFILPIFMFLFSWAVGAASIKLLREKRAVIVLRKV